LTVRNDSAFFLLALFGLAYMLVRAGTVEAATGPAESLPGPWAGSGDPGGDPWGDPGGAWGAQDAQGGAPEAAAPYYTVAPEESLYGPEIGPSGPENGSAEPASPDQTPAVNLDAEKSAQGPGILDAVRASFASSGGNFDPLKNSNMLAFLAMIRQIEGGAQGYNALFGGGRFDDFSDHPRIVVIREGRDTAGNPRTYRSSAAGAYQIMAATFDDVAPKNGVRDFSPDSQDQIAVALIKRRGALGDVIAGRFSDAVAKTRKEWASLPGAGYNQPENSLSKIRSIYIAEGGEIATV